MPIHDYLDIEWRFSGVQPRFFGLDPWFVLVFPLTLLGIARGFPTAWFLVLVAFAAACVFASFFTPHRTVGGWLRALRTRHVQRLQWPTDLD